ncbi:hypothetical protein Tco_1041839 [Tanacetum coccineum]|uniref:Uncharacterized protein n=1 Tax=Tanacetum coccineum TaxID=301880 RepID=A0ABQ5GI19_9ASTR
MGDFGTDIEEKDEKRSQNNKTGLGMEKQEKTKSKLAMSLDNTSSAVTYTSISSDLNGLSWGIPLVNVGELPEMGPYEEIAQQGHVMYKGLKTKQKR